MSEIVEPKRPARKWRAIDLVFLGILGLVAVFVVWFYGAAYNALWSYEPKEGDVIFQSLPHNRLVDAIEGVTGSSYSHCGIVAKQGDSWVVLESIGRVKSTPLKSYLFRGRGHGFAVYRFKEPYKKYVSETLKETRKLMGRPYDVRYRMDDEKIYCSELIYKAYRSASGQELGKLARFGDLNWQPYKETVEFFEKGPVPVDRMMITPKDLAKADQLEPVFVHRIETE